MSAFASKKSGPWNDPTVWGNAAGGAVPGAGDTVLVDTGHNVTVTDGYAATFGRSPVAAPVTAATVATNAGAVTALPNGTYRIAYTFVDANGVETGPGTSESAVFTVANGGTTGQARATLPGVASVPGAVSLNVYLTNTSATNALTERLYCTGVTGATLDLVGPSWGNAAAAGQAAGGSTPFAAAAALPPQYDGVVLGTLTVGQTDGAATPASLTCRGEMLQGTIASPANVTFRAGTALNINAAAAPSPAAQTYRWTIGYQSRLALNGTEAARCKVSSAAGGGAGYFFGSGSQTGQIQETVTDFVRIGDATNPLVVATPGPSPGGLLMLGGSTDNCGQVKQMENGGAAVFRFEGVRFGNTAAAVPLLIQSTSALTTGTRTVLDCGFDKVVNMYGPRDVTLKRNAFGGGWSVSGNYRWAAFEDIFAYTSANVNGSPNWQFAGDCKRVYLYVEGGVNPHFCKPNSLVGDLLVEGPIFEYGGVADDGDDFNFETPASVTTYTLRYGLKLPNAAGLSSGTFFSGLGNGNVRLVCEHCTFHGGGGGDSSGGRIGETFPSFTGQVQSMRGNLFWDTVERGYVLFDMTGTPALDAVAADKCDYNGQFKAAVGTCTVNGVSVPVRGYRGLNVSGTVPPGAHDVYEDPRFVDPNRCLRKWDAAQGGAGTAAGAIARLLAEGRKAAELIAWTFAGFAPTNPAYHNVAGEGLAFPGDAATLDATGAPLRGTLGAVAYKAVNPTAAKLLLLNRTARAA